jgi:3-methyladenine DNA glycosylase AlkD
VRTVARRYRKIMKEDGWMYDDFLNIAEQLLKKDTFEEKTVAFSMIASMKKDFRKSDFRIFERWLKKYVSNWAHTDDIAPHIIAEMVERWPELQADVFKWTKSKNRWVRRAAAVTYVPHGRRGRFHKQIFKTADAMLGDPDDMVRKGVGWMLKEASNFDERAVVKYLLPRREKTSRLVLRYATEKVSKKNRKLVLSR